MLIQLAQFFLPHCSFDFFQHVFASLKTNSMHQLLLLHRAQYCDYKQFKSQNRVKMLHMNNQEKQAQHKISTGWETAPLQTANSKIRLQ